MTALLTYVKESLNQDCQRYPSSASTRSSTAGTSATANSLFSASSLAAARRITAGITLKPVSSLSCWQQPAG